MPPKASERIAAAAALLSGDVQQQLLSEIATAETSGGLVDLLILFQDLRDSHESLDKACKLIYKTLDDLNKRKVPEAIDASGQDLARVPALKRSFYILNKRSATILDKPRGHEWLRENGGSELITATVNAQTLTGFLTQYALDHGKDPPEDVFKVTPYRTTGSSRYTPKTT